MWFVQGRSSVHVINEQKLLAREFDKTALNVSPYLHNSQNSAWGKIPAGSDISGYRKYRKYRPKYRQIPTEIYQLKF
jgi:hypothetical protein